MPVTRVLVTNEGKVVVEGINYSGDQCLQDLQKLVEALKGLGVEINVELQRRKPEAQAVSEVIEA